MNINANINSVSFGKTPVMTCNIKHNETKKKVEATLYKMDTQNPDDLFDIKLSKTGRKIYNDFKEDMMQYYPTHDFYLLQNDDTREVICAAETSHHYRRTSDKTDGMATVIDEIAVNKKYNNAAEPVLAHIVKTASERFDKSVVSAVGKDELPDIKRASFTETKLGNWMIPEKRYASMLDKAEERSQTVFLA